MRLTGRYKPKTNLYGSILALLDTNFDVVSGARGQSPDDWGIRQRGVIGQGGWEGERSCVTVEDVVLHNNAVSRDRGAEVDHHCCGCGHQADDVHSCGH